MLNIESAVEYVGKIWPGVEIVGAVFVPADPCDYVAVYVGRADDAEQVQVWIEGGEIYGEW